MIASLQREQNSGFHSEQSIEAYHSLGELREPRAFAAWFRRILFKQCDRITRRRTLTQVPLEVAEGVPSSAPGPVEIYEQRELQSFVAHALQQLPAEERLAITLRRNRIAWKMN